MNIEELREYCLSKKDAEETLPFGPDTLVYKVKSKVFLLTGLDEIEFRFNVKCDPDKAIELREEFPCVLPGWHMNKKHWNTIVVDGSVSNKQLKDSCNRSGESLMRHRNKASSDFIPRVLYPNVS